MYVTVGRKNFNSLKKRSEVKKETHRERKQHRETKQPKQKSIYPHKRRTKNSQVQAGLITEAERENYKIKDRESAHTLAHSPVHRALHSKESVTAHNRTRKNN